MEALYKKLYDKYIKLKNKELSEFDQLNKDQEVKFMNYVSAVEELIEHLKSENNKLHEQVDDLRNEVASIRHAKDNEVADYQRLAMEESKKSYSFSLTWLSKAPEEEANLLYHVLSLGTIEIVAPEWMRDDIKFSKTMCPIFFQRVSNIIKLCH